MHLDKRLTPPPRKPWIYYIALTADIAKWSDQRGMAEIILNLAYGAADVMHEEALAVGRA